MSITKFQTPYNFKETEKHRSVNSGEILVEEVHEYYINQIADILIASEQNAIHQEKLYYELKGEYTDNDAEQFSETAALLSRQVFGSDIMEVCDTLMTSKQIAAMYQRNRQLFTSVMSDYGVSDKISNGYYDTYRDDIIHHSRNGTLAEFLLSKGFINKEQSPEGQSPTPTPNASE